MGVQRCQQWCRESNSLPFPLPPPRTSRATGLVADVLGNPRFLFLPSQYKSGFATTQPAYEKAVVPLFSSLDRLEALLAEGNKTYLVGDRLTEADVRLFTTIIRFDPVYFSHFKCNIGSSTSFLPSSRSFSSSSLSELTPSALAPRA